MRIENYKDSLDQWGLVCSKKTRAHYDDEKQLGRKVTPEDPWMDGGDSCNRTCAAYILDILSRTNRFCFPRVDHFFTEDHYIIRHPDQRFWYSEKNRCSRDQMLPLLALAALMGPYVVVLKRIFKNHLKRGLLFTTNTRKNYATKENHNQEYAHGKIRDYSWKLPDITLFTTWALYIRGFRKPYLYPLLILFDLQGLINCILIALDVKDNDVINHCIVSKISIKIMPTPISILTNELNNYHDLGLRLEKFYDRPDLPYWLGKEWAKYLRDSH